MSEQSMEKNGTDRASERAKSIWLAGLGAYGRAFDEAHDRYEKASKETTKMFENLVVKGRRLEDEAQGKFKDVRSKSSSSIDERISKVKESLGFGGSDSSNSFDQLNKKIDDLSAKVDKLLEAVSLNAVAPKTKTKAKSLN